jgi:hypothetical protein
MSTRTGSNATKFDCDLLLEFGKGQVLNEAE